LTTAPFDPVASVVMFAGNVIVGLSASWTLITKLPLEELLCESVTEQLTVFGPSGKVEPEAGEQIGVTEPSTMSVAEAE